MGSQYELSRLCFRAEVGKCNHYPKQLSVLSVVEYLPPIHTESVSSKEMELKQSI